MINEQQFNQILRRSRQLSDANQTNVAEQWLLWAPLWQDSVLLRKAADQLEATYQKLTKWARAGAIISAGIFDRECDQSQEFLVQLSYFDPSEWEKMAEVAILADLGPSELKVLRDLRDKLRETGTHFCPMCDHGGEWKDGQVARVEYVAAVRNPLDESEGESNERDR